MGGWAVLCPRSFGNILIDRVCVSRIWAMLNDKLNAWLRIEHAHAIPFRKPVADQKAGDPKANANIGISLEIFNPAPPLFDLCVGIAMNSHRDLHSDRVIDY